MASSALDTLTPRQREVAGLVAQSWTTKRIAAELRISEQRVRVLVASIAYQINADPSLDERIQVALWWREVTALDTAA